MKIQNKILLISFGVAILVTLIMAFTTDTFPGNGFFLMAGVIGMLGGGGYVVVGLLLLFLKHKRYARGFLTSGFVLMLIGIVLFNALSMY